MSSRTQTSKIKPDIVNFTVLMMYDEYPDVGVIAGDLNGNPTKVRLNKSGLSQFLVGDDVNLIALLFEGTQ